MLVAVDPKTLSSARGDLERLALRSRNDATRQGGFAALVRTDGAAERAWDLASASPQGRIDLIRAVRRPVTLRCSPAFTPSSSRS